MILKRTVRRVICNSRSFISSISVILHWIPILYKDRDWDWYFLLKIERTKIRQMEKYFRESSIAEGDENNAKWLHVCDCSEYLAKIIYNIHNDISITELLRDKSLPMRLIEEKFDEK